MDSFESRMNPRFLAESEKIQDYFMISFEKLKRGWTLTTYDLRTDQPHNVAVHNNTYCIF